MARNDGDVELIAEGRKPVVSALPASLTGGELRARLRDVVARRRLAESRAAKPTRKSLAQENAELARRQRELREHTQD